MRASFANTSDIPKYRISYRICSLYYNHPTLLLDISKKQVEFKLLPLLDIFGEAAAAQDLDFGSSASVLSDLSIVSLLLAVRGLRHIQIDI